MQHWGAAERVAVYLGLLLNSSIYEVPLGYGTPCLSARMVGCMRPSNDWTKNLNANLQGAKNISEKKLL